MLPWLTFRGLHTDDLEGFSADHRLTFRGLPAEGLGDCSREAASRSTLVAANQGLLSSPQEGLSWAAHRFPNLGGLLLGSTVPCFLPLVGLRQNAAAIVEATGSLGGIWAAGWPTFLAPFLAPIPFAGTAASVPHATLGGGSPHR